MADTFLHDIVPGALDRFFTSLQRAGRGVLVLDYDGTLAPFHVDRYRAFPSDGVLAQRNLDIDVFNGGIELSVSGRSKGDAMRAILSSNIDRYPVAFLGDDMSDENGFEVLASSGLPVLVEARRPDTAAAAWASLGPGVVAFLDRWMQALSIR